MLFVCTNNSISVHSVLTTLPSWHPAAVALPCGHHPASSPGWRPHSKGCEPVLWFHQQDVWSGGAMQGWRAPTHGSPLPQCCLGLHLPLRERHEKGWHSRADHEATWLMYMSEPSRLSDSRVRKSLISLMRSLRSLLERSTLFLVAVALSRAAWALPLASSAFVLASATWMKGRNGYRGHTKLWRDAGTN